MAKDKNGSILKVGYGVMYDAGCREIEGIVVEVFAEANKIKIETDNGTSTVNAEECYLIHSWGYTRWGA